MNQATNYGFKNVCINVFRTQNVFAQMIVFLHCFLLSPHLISESYCLGQQKLSSGVLWIWKLYGQARRTG